ncbi:hypothetical protein M433DRAFT_217597 [Acidomyces richmondensis BFW]|nr:hypothetical protein M433DRAFT_217597 [Acidomyces richmondensis BFW]
MPRERTLDTANYPFVSKKKKKRTARVSVYCLVGSNACLGGKGGGLGWEEMPVQAGGGPSFAKEGEGPRCQSPSPPVSGRIEIGGSERMHVRDDRSVSAVGRCRETGRCFVHECMEWPRRKLLEHVRRGGWPSHGTVRPDPGLRRGCDGQPARFPDECGCKAFDRTFCVSHEM